jgi:hypothetical protein
MRFIFIRHDYCSFLDPLSIQQEVIATLLKDRHFGPGQFGPATVTGRSRQGIFGSPASCLSDSEFLPGWKKCPGVAELRRGIFFIPILHSPAIPEAV